MKVGVRSTLIVLGIVAGLGLLTFLGVKAFEEL
jgi:hypothetical protein